MEEDFFNISVISDQEEIADYDDIKSLEHPQEDH